MRAINSSYPVSLNCGYTSSDVMCAFSAKEQIDLFHREACCLDTFRSLVEYDSTLSVIAICQLVGKTVVAVDSYLEEIRGSPVIEQNVGALVYFEVQRRSANRLRKRWGKTGSVLIQGRAKRFTLAAQAESLELKGGGGEWALTAGSGGGSSADDSYRVC